MKAFFHDCALINNEISFVIKYEWNSAENEIQILLEAMCTAEATCIRQRIYKS